LSTWSPSRPVASAYRFTTQTSNGLYSAAVR
jgi:hypothetical protein